MATGILAGLAFGALAGLALGAAAILVALDVVWWVRGGRGWHVEEELHVDAAPEAIFAILDDPDRTRELDPRVVRVEVVEREPPHRLVQELPASAQRRTFALEPEGEGTRVRLAVRALPANPVVRLFRGMAQGRQARAFAELLGRLRDYAETGSRLP